MKKVSRILHVFNKMDTGGAETLIMNIYRKIDREKIQFDFVVQSQDVGFYDNEIKSLGGKIHYIPKMKIYNILSYIKLWNIILSSKEYDIVHVHARGTAIFFVPIAKKLNIKCIIHCHIYTKFNNIIDIIKHIIQLPLRFMADERIACSQKAGLQLYGKKPFIILKNGVDTSRFKYSEYKMKKIKKEYNLEDKFVIGNIARFSHQKNHTFLIDVFHEIYKKNSKAILLLVGGGELEEKVKQKVKLLNIQDRVIFAGVRGNIDEIMNGIDVMLFPSLYEGLPVTLIEAQVNGINIVASDTITEETNITNKIQFVSLNKSAEYWADIILKYEDMHRCEYVDSKIIKAGYDISDITHRIQQFYLNLV